MESKAVCHDVRAMARDGQGNARPCREDAGSSSVHGERVESASVAQGAAVLDISDDEEVSGAHACGSGKAVAAREVPCKAVRRHPPLQTCATTGRPPSTAKHVSPEDSHSP